ncbi:potassium channel family protein [Marinilactibacillus kalidii]|uniref:potassium channel family protein n=1 Tax=Marinilactibacillus kalidii TaxID=2820274 RepID=UPI001ABECC62|nr:TrkA family potassium uptake protein [Marinilactibacillus kalidii]
MKLFSTTDEKQRQYLVIGAGRLGANLANDLSERGEDVVIIDKTKSAFRKLAPSFGGMTITGDATNLSVLTEAQIEKAAVVIVVTDEDNTNIMISQLAKVLFNKKQVISRLYDPERKSVYEDFDIQLIYPAILSVNEITRMLATQKQIGAEIH